MVGDKMVGTNGFNSGLRVHRENLEADNEYSFFFFIRSVDADCGVVRRSLESGEV